MAVEELVVPTSVKCPIPAEGRLDDLDRLWGNIRQWRTAPHISRTGRAQVTYHGES